MWMRQLLCFSPFTSSRCFHCLLGGKNEPYRTPCSELYLPLQSQHSWRPQAWNGRHGTSQVTWALSKGPGVLRMPTCQPCGKPWASSASSPVPMSPPHRLHCHRPGPGVGKGRTRLETRQALPLNLLPPEERPPRDWAPASHPAKQMCPVL